MSRFLIILVPQILLSLPLFIVYLAGMAGCMRSRQTAPRASTVALRGVSVLLIGLSLRCVLMTWVMVYRPGGNPVGMSLPLVMIIVGHNVIDAIGFAMVLYTVFMGRGTQVLSN